MPESDVTLPLPAAQPRAPITRGFRLMPAMVTLRPAQWIKNLLVIGAAGAAGAIGHDDVPVRVSLAFVAFCMLASGIYAVNDVRDAAEDRLHPRKRFRPVAAGQIDPWTVSALGVGLIAGGLALCTAIRPLLVLVGAGYVGLTLTYTFVWRHLLLLDIVAIAGGFVLRAVAGGVAAPVALSRWFVLVISAAAVFVAAGKRQAELMRTDALAKAGPRPVPLIPDASPVAPVPARRRVLEGYTAGRLRLILSAAAILAIAAYTVWAFELPSVRGIPWRLLTVIPFAASLGRYGILIGRGHGEAPEDLLLRDRLLQLTALAWLALFALGVHAAA